MPNNTTERVAATVRAELKRQGLTQEDAARALNMNQSSVSRRLLGQLPFNTNEIDAVATLLGVPVVTLVADQPAAVSS